MQHILVAYDESEPAGRALKRAAELARAFGSRVTVTSVAPVMLGAGRSMGPIDPTDTPEDHRRLLDAARAALSAESLEADFVAAVGDPADTIVQVARDRSADLIVVGSRELGVVQRMLGQSVSQDVARHARCDVLIVH